MLLQFSRAVFLAAMLLGSAPMLAPPPAFAESATSEGAKALAQSLAPYFGQSAFDRGLITIAPKGEAYELNFDLQGIVDGFGLPLPKDAVRIGRYSLLVAPLPDGSWKVTSDNFLKVDIKGPTPQGDMAASLSASGSVFEGVFDPKFAAFLSFTQKIPTFDVKARAPNSDVAATATDVEAQLQGKGLADGSVSGKFQETFRHVVETVKMTPAAKPDGPPSSPVNVSYDIGPITYDGAFENLRTKEFRDLFAFLIAHHDQELVALQDELKDKILATFPLWKNIDATVKVENLALDTALGRFGAKSVVQSLHQTGLVAQAAMELGFSMGGLSVPPGLVPAWAAPLVPTALDIDVKFQMNDLDKIAHAAVTNLDLRPNQSPDASKLAIIATMAMGSEPKLTLAPGHISSPSLDLYFHGEMALVPKPTGTLTLEAEGLDKALSRLQEAAKSNPGLQQAVLGLTVAKGLAKPGANGRSFWVVDYGADGAVSVNGKTVSPAK